jgi:hypothetical protein
VQNIPALGEMTKVELSDHRNFIINGMGRCIVIIEQDNFPKNIGGMLITSHETVSVKTINGLEDITFHKLHILIDRNLCSKTTLEERIKQKITAIHEFTHTVAVLSAISKIHTKELIILLKEKLRKKAHAIHYEDIKQLLDELSFSLSIKLNKQEKFNKKQYYPDEHFRLGFEDIPVSYPVIFNEFLFSKEMFEEYFSRDVIITICKAISENDNNSLLSTVPPIILNIAIEKALNAKFVLSRFLDILLPIYISYTPSKKISG